MPQMGNMKFPYTKEGIARYKKIKAAVGKRKKKKRRAVKPRGMM